MKKSRLKQIIKEEYVDIMLNKKLREAEEGDTPDHFGGGKNIDVFGYQTEHFDICKSAVMLFTKLKEKNLEGMAVDHAKKAAQHIDNVFGIEKDVVEEGSAAPEQMEEAVDNDMLFGYEIGALSMHIDEDLTRDTAFHKLHIMEIANRYDGSMTEAKLEKEKFTEPEQMRNEGKINEISAKAGLEDVILGRTSAIEGVKMSKELAMGFIDWIIKSPYGRKYASQLKKARISALIGPANAFGIERYLSPKAKKEFKDVYKKHGPKREVKGESTVKLKKLMEARPKKVTKQMWNKMSEYQRMDALLTVIKDPDDAEDHLEKKWNELGSLARDMYTENIKEAAPGYMHDCASKVIHKEHGAGTCIPEQHNLVREGKKWVVTEYDVKFNSGKIVKNVPVSELKIVTESNHGHKRRKKKKSESIKIKKSMLERMMKLTKEQKTRMVEKLVFYRDKNDKLRRFDTDDQ